MMTRFLTMAMATEYSGCLIAWRRPEQSGVMEKRNEYGAMILSASAIWPLRGSVSSE